MNKKILQIVILCCCTVLISCKKTDKILFSYIKSTIPHGGVFNMKKALNVDFDTAFLFGECINEKEIERALGMDYTKKTFLQDSEYKLLLLKNHKIVFDNSFFCNHVEFFFFDTMYQLPKDEKWYYYMWTDSIFEASPKETLDEIIYQIQPIRIASSHN